MAPHGQSVQYEERAVAFNLTGVGSGAAKCVQTATIPIAVQFKDKPATLEHLKTNVATGSEQTCLRSWESSVQRQKIQ